MSPENDVQTPAEVAAAVAAASPGAMIRLGRERMHLSLDDLVGVTKLSYHTLEALEQDNYNALLEPVYVRGYYRKCAKVLDLSEKALLDAYQSRVAPKLLPPPAKLRLASGADLGSTSRLPVTLAIAAAVIAVLICAVVWIARSGTQTPSPEQALPLPAVTPPEISFEAGAASAVPTADLVATPVTEVPAQTPTVAAAAPALPSVPTPEPATAAPTVAVTPAAAVPAAAAPAAATSAADAAVLSFSATSWVRVDDARGKTLFNGLAQPGESHVLNGALPLNVFLGNASAVKVEFAGRAVDTQTFQRDNKTARFTLPPRN